MRKFHKITIWKKRNMKKWADKKTLIKNGETEKEKTGCKRKSGIFIKLGVGFIVPVFFVILVGMISYHKAEVGMGEKYTESTIQALNMIVGYIDYGCEMVEAEAFQYAYDTDLSAYYMGLLNKKMSEKAIVYNRGKDAIRNAALVNPMIQGIYIITEKGIDILTSGTQPLQTGFLEEWKAAEEVKSGWYDNHTFLDEKMQIPENGYVLNYCCLSDAGKACVVIDIKTEEIRSIMDKMDLEEDSIAAFITPNGKEVCTESNIEIQVFEQDFYKRAMQSEEMYGSEFVSYNQIPYLFLYSKSEKTGSAVCVLVPKSKVIEQAYSIRILTVILVVVASVLALLLGGWISAHIQRNMKRIVKIMEKAAQGNLTETVSVTGNDEFSILAEALTKMINSTKILLDKMQKTSKQLEESNSKVNETSEEIGIHSRSIRDALDEISKGMEIQSESAQECLEKTNCLSDNIRLVSTEVKNVEKQIHMNGQLVEQSVQAMNALNIKSEKASEKTQEVKESIYALREHTAKIENFVNVINDIARQTNLLSLNASIEAARAGSAGRGFSVVAEEIRNLAAKSVESASEIEKSVEIINCHMEKSVNSAQSAGVIVKEQREYVLDMIPVFETMNMGMEEMFKALEIIIESVGSVDVNRQETLTAISSISSVIEETTASVGTVAGISRQLMVYVSKLDDMAVTLDDNMGELKKEIEKFVVE